MKDYTQDVGSIVSALEEKSSERSMSLVKAFAEKLNVDVNVASVSERPRFSVALAILNDIIDIIPNLPSLIPEESADLELDLKELKEELL
jgi:hypothetical protein